MDYKYNYFSSSICQFDLLHDSQYITVYFVMEGTAQMVREGIFHVYQTGEFFITTPEMNTSYVEIINGTLLCLSINKTHFNQFYLKNILNVKHSSDIYDNVLNTFMHTLLYLHDNNLFLADIYAIQLLNYVRIYFDMFNQYTFCQPNHIIINQVINYVNLNFKQPLKLSELANRFYVNSSFLSRKFKSEMNMNYSDYVKQVKIMHLADDLLNKRKSNETKLWQEYNFVSYRAFLKHFKLYFNMNPRDFIKYKRRFQKPNYEISPEIYLKVSEYIQTLSKT